ncbi:MAG: histidine ammonia-lyase [Phycisphaerales bacterium]
MDTSRDHLTLSGAPLTIEQFVAVARHRACVSIAPAAIAKMTASRAVIEDALADGLAHYGINTGFGSLSRQRIDRNDLKALQRNLIRSHAAGVGTPLPDEIVRGMMLLLAASLSRGLSGARSLLAERIVELLNRGVHPMVPQTGSVGASGDLAPLSHVALALIGEGQVRFEGQVMESAEAHRRCALDPIVLEAKEGLALINGTHLMATLGAFAVADFGALLENAIGAAAMSIDASRATDSFLDDRIHAARNQVGQREVAASLRDWLSGTQIVGSHAENDPRVQDPYSLRCMAQVIGAAKDCLSYVKQIVERELGAVTDNPLVFVGGQGEIISGGNFHGMPLSIALDSLVIAVTHVAGISERRVFWMTAAFDTESHLKPYLATGQPGLSSGLMIAQYTAAACCNEMITLCTPAGVSNIGTSAGMEDYNSFGPRAGFKALRAIELARSVVAIELLTAAAGIDCHRPLRSGGKVEALHARIRAIVPPLHEDRSPAPDIAAIESLLRN